MIFRRILFFCLLLLLTTVKEAAAQAKTKPVQTRDGKGVVEEYSVLATDKTIRQGSYVRYRPAGPLAGVAVIAAGAYENGLKEGEWRTFSEFYPWNKMLSKGSYHADLQEGLWLYYHPSQERKSQPKTTQANSTNPKEGFTVNIDDTTAVPQAKGAYLHGQRLGLWTFYDYKGRAIQKVNYSTLQLLYWQPDSITQLSGAAAANHPLLYAGGKAKLSQAIFDCVDVSRLLATGKHGVADIVVSVDENGRHTQVALATQVPPSRYEALVLAGLQKMKADWLPKVVDGKSTASEYRFKLNTSAPVVDGNRRGVQVSLELLGD